MTLACIGLGSNLGDSLEILRGALKHIANAEQIHLDDCSGCYRSKAWGVEQQPDFLNAVAAIHTELSAADLLAFLQQIEQDFGRQRTEKWGPRTLDLDILCYGELEQDKPELSLPHPYFAQRDFVLIPLAEIYPDLSIAGRTVADWLGLYLNEHPGQQLPEKLPVSLT